MKYPVLHNRKTLLYLLAIGNTIAFVTWQVMLNNFVVERAAFTGEEIGLLQSLREVPGFLAFTAILVMVFVRQQRLAILSLVTLGIGTAITAFYPSALCGIADLLGRHVPRRHARAVVQCHVSRQPTPAAAGFDDPVARAQLQLATDMIHLGLLRRFNTHAFLGKIGTGVLHLFIQPQSIKVVANIVVMVDVFPGTIVAVRTGFALLQLFNDFDGALRLRRTERRDQKTDEIPFYGDPSTGERVTESYIALAQ